MWSRWLSDGHIALMFPAICEACPAWSWKADHDGAADPFLRQLRMPPAATLAEPAPGGELPSDHYQARPDEAELRALHGYWRAANYLSAGQIYLMANPLLRQPRGRRTIKPRLLGHWGTTPGLNPLRPPQPGDPQLDWT